HPINDAGKAHYLTQTVCFHRRWPVAIQDSGEWCVGSEPTDIEPYLVEFSRTEAAYPSSAFRLVRCQCGSNRFRLLRALNISERTCVACGQVRHISRDAVRVDWEEATEEELPEPFRCVRCVGEEANVGVAFAGYPESPEIDGVKWFFVGVRCTGCGTL